MKKIFKLLLDSKNPIYLFDDDPDGLCSFLQLYLYKREGSGVVVKSSPILDEKYLPKANNQDFDVVFVLDKPMISEDFIKQVKKQIVWIDHHPPQKPPGRIAYYNPRIQDDSISYPTSEITYDLIQQNAEQEFIKNNKKRMLWIALIGTIADWKIPHFIKEAKKEFPELFTSLNGDKLNLTKPEDLLFNSLVGRLVKILNSTLKGRTSLIKKRVKVLTRIKSPYEILAYDKLAIKLLGKKFLKQYETPQGKFIYKNFSSLNEEYEKLLSSAVKSFKLQITKSNPKVLFFSYYSKTSMTSSLSNELLYHFPKKVVVVCRKKSGNMMCSFRYYKGDLPNKINQALKGLDGYGGGHDNASGGHINESEFNIFLERFKKLFK